jgi:hypothetical protein
VILLAAGVSGSGILNLPVGVFGHPEPNAAPGEPGTDPTALAEVTHPPFGPSTGHSTGWQNATQTGVGPTPHGDLAAMTYDVADGYNLWFGISWTSGSNNSKLVAETWSFSGGRWTNLSGALSVTPPPIQGPSLVYDPVAREVVLLEGRYNQSPVTWTYRAGTWTNITATAGGPSVANLEPAMTFDAAEGSILLADFVTGADGNLTTQTWTFASGRWANISSTAGVAPPGRIESSMAYDAADRESVLFGGVRVVNLGSVPQLGGELNDTWGFRSGTWVNLTRPGSASPITMDSATMTLLPGGYPFLFGGYGGQSCNSAVPGGCYTNKSWLFVNGTWNDLAPAFPGAPPGAQTDLPMAWDYHDGYLVLVTNSDDTWYLHWNTSAPVLALTPPKYGVVPGGILEFNVIGLGGTPPYNATLCVGPGNCTYDSWSSGPGPRSWMVSFPTAGDVTVFGHLIDDNATVATAVVEIRVASPEGPLNVSVAIRPLFAMSPFNVTVWVNASGGVPPYYIEILFGDESNGSTPNDVPIVHGYTCPEGSAVVEGHPLCSFPILVAVTDALDEVWSTPFVYVSTCENANETCSWPFGVQLPIGGSPGFALSTSPDPRINAGLVAIGIAATGASATFGIRRKMSREQARLLRLQMDVMVSTPEFPRNPP